MLSGALFPLPSEVIEKSDFESNFYDVSQKDLVKKGAIYGIPLEMDTLSLFINPQIFAEAEGGAATPPATWQEFIEAAEKLTKRDDKGKIQIAGAAIGTYDNITHAP